MCLQKYCTWLPCWHLQLKTRQHLSSFASTVSSGIKSCIMPPFNSDAFIIGMDNYAFSRMLKHQSLPQCEMTKKCEVHILAKSIEIMKTIPLDPKYDTPWFYLSSSMGKFWLFEKNFNNNFAHYQWATSIPSWWQHQAMQWLHGHCHQAAPWARQQGHCYHWQAQGGIVAFALLAESP